MYIATEAPGGYLCIILFLLLFCNGTTCSSVDGESFLGDCPKECRCSTTSPSSNTVDCSGRSIISIPLDIPRNTTVLDLRNIGLSEIPPYALSHLENLNALYLGGNDITAFNENSFAGLKALEYLNLFPIYPGMNVDYNTFPPTLFRELTSLKTLHIGGMGSGENVQQDYIDCTLAPLHQLEELFLSYLPHGNLSFGPGYSNLSSLKTLVFKRYSSTETQLQKKAFVWLKNCPIEKLAFIDCNINRSDPDMLSIFPHLKVLDLECSYFLSSQNVEGFICGLKNNTVETIGLNNIFQKRDNGAIPVSHWTISASAFKCLENTPLRTLELIQNRIEGFDLNNLHYFPNLEYLDLSNNIMMFFPENEKENVGENSAGDYWAYLYPLLRKLKYMRIDNNLINKNKAPPKCDLTHSFWKGHPSFKLKQYVHVARSLNEQNMPLPVIKVFLPANLEFVSMSWWPVWDDGVSSYCALRGSLYFYPNKVRFLKMEGIGTKYIPYYIFYGLDNLEHYDASHNILNCLPRDFFNGHFPSLRSLNLGDNKLGPLISEDGIRPVKLPRLEFLDLSLNEIRTIPKKFFDHLVSLQRLVLRGNYLKKVSFSMVNFVSVEYIDLSNNKLQAFSSEEMENIRKVNSSFSVHLNMTNNPVDCTLCDGEEFLQWLIFSNITVTFSNDSNCPMNGSKISLWTTLNELREKCDISDQIKGPNQWLSVGISLTSIAGVTCGLIAAYIYRWKIKYRLYLLRRRLRIQGFITTPPHGHVYISYDDGDDHWVVNKLLRHLEEENELDVIIDQRDFIGGASLAEAIVEAVDNSRKTVLVLSENFVLNSWCEFEFEMSLARGYNSVIPVMFQTVPFDAMTKSLRKFIKARGYIKWSDSEAGKRLFWKRLMDAILDVNDHLVHDGEVDDTEML
ncbi:toll-like receptor 4 [Lingula anatina]|uniref:Toll-like receptor 4 n=1 Tax=Lingula anatina TaxID=7574 RepID=A0A1S3IP24_LINAN|nr:toll-like receptor 4 [Lingula anatina]|eukprot:XP_013399952.1 toll-like receptor 4 [Lingula anatina]